MKTNPTRFRAAAVMTAAFAVACIGPGSPISYLPRSAEAAPAGQAVSSSVQSIESGGATRRYRLFVPSSYQPGVPMALVLSMHGMTMNSLQEERLSSFSAAAQQAGFIVAYPDGTGFFFERWNTGSDAAGQKDLQFLRDLIGHLKSRFTIDPTRVYATGISQGAMMAHRLGCTTADEIAGLGLVAGSYSLAGCEPSRPMPIVAFHGTADSITPYGGEGGRSSIAAWAAGSASRNGCTNGPNVTYKQGSVTAQTWDGCRENATVSLYTVEGGGHAWPGSKVSFFWSGRTTQDVDATAVMVSFFAAHPRQ